MAALTTAVAPHWDQVGRRHLVDLDLPANASPALAQTVARLPLFKARLPHQLMMTFPSWLPAMLLQSTLNCPCFLSLVSTFHILPIGTTDDHYYIRKTVRYEYSLLLVTFEGKRSSAVLSDKPAVEMN